MVDQLIDIGTEVSGFSRRIDQTRMVMYAAATWDWHRLHYDADFATKLGFAGPVVDGQMLGAYLAEQVLDAFGPTTRLRWMSFRLRGTVFAGETVTVRGRVSDLTLSENGPIVTVDQEITVHKRLCVSGTTIALVKGI